MISVTLGMPVWNRADYLPRTLRSIRRQNYDGPLELVIVESGDDGRTRLIAEEYGCRYASVPRDMYPEFQSVTTCWNRCALLSSNDLLILQCGEIEHESPHVIKDLVRHVCTKNHSVATALLRNLDKDGNFVDWYNHPREGSRPGWVSGSGPFAMMRKDFFAVGGFEELFYGYGHEDDYFYFLCKKNGMSIDYVETAVCGHHEHPRVPYDEVTGYANRALMQILYYQVQHGIRRPKANNQQLIIQTPPTHEQVGGMLSKILDKGYAIPAFAAWAQDYLAGDHRPEEAFVAHRKASNDKEGWPQLCEMAGESAWGLCVHDRDLIIAKEAGLPSWENRVKLCADYAGTWSNIAAMEFQSLMQRGKTP